MSHSSTLDSIKMDLVQLECFQAAADVVKARTPQELQTILIGLTGFFNAVVENLDKDPHDFPVESAEARRAILVKFSETITAIKGLATQVQGLRDISKPPPYSKSPKLDAEYANDLRLAARDMIMRTWNLRAGHNRRASGFGIVAIGLLTLADGLDPEGAVNFEFLESQCATAWGKLNITDPPQGKPDSPPSGF